MGGRRAGFVALLGPIQASSHHPAHQAGYVNCETHNILLDGQPDDLLVFHQAFEVETNILQRGIFEICQRAGSNGVEKLANVADID